MTCEKLVQIVVHFHRCVRKKKKKTFSLPSPLKRECMTNCHCSQSYSISYYFTYYYSYLEFSIPLKKTKSHLLFSRTLLLFIKSNIFGALLACRINKILKLRMLRMCVHIFFLSISRSSSSSSVSIR